MSNKKISTNPSSLRSLKKLMLKNGVPLSVCVDDGSAHMPLSEENFPKKSENIYVKKSESESGTDSLRS